MVALGLASRRYAGATHASPLPQFVALYAGDTLWALMAFITVAFAAPAWSTIRVGIAALVISFGVELSQLYHAPWIDAVRATWLGGLALGYGFLWSDILCYSVGVGLAWPLDRVARRLEGQ